jgi:hypothetical protein
VGLAGVVAALGLAAAAPTPAAAGSAPSGIGNDSVYGFSISPAFDQTGLVLAAANQVSSTCPSGGCARHLWLSHDGGASWHLVTPPPGWVQAPPTIGVDAGRHESLFAEGSSGVERSDDSGRTWSRVGSAGLPTAAPTYSRDSSVGVIGNSDYLLQGGSSHPITASSGQLVETGLSFASTFPNGGSHAPALLAGLDRKTQAPVVESCSADLTCGNASNLPVASQWSNVATLAMSSNYTSDGVVFAQIGQTSVYKSVDGGHTFTPLTVVSEGATYTRIPMLVVPSDYREAGPDRTVYTAVLEVWQDMTTRPPTVKVGGGIYRSADGGGTWSKISAGSPLDGGAAAVAVAPNGRLFAGYLSGTTGHSGLLCSADGHTWQASCPRVGNWSDATGSAAVASHGRGDGGMATSGGGAGGSNSSSTSGAGGAVTGETGAIAGQSDGVAGVRNASAVGGHPWLWILIAAVVAGIVTLAAVTKPWRRGSAPPG